jgi:hypothetical protein
LAIMRTSPNSIFSSNVGRALAVVAIFQVGVIFAGLIDIFLRGETVAGFWNLLTVAEPEIAIGNLLVFINLFFLSFIHLSIWLPTIQNWRSSWESNRREVTEFRLRLPPRSQVFWAIHAGASMVCWVWSAIILVLYLVLSFPENSLLNQGIVGWILVTLILMGVEYILLWSIPRHFIRRNAGEAGEPALQ